MREQPRETRYPDVRVTLLQAAPLAPGRTDQFAGVAAALAARGIAADRALADGHPPTLPEGTRLVAVADCLSPVCRHALRLAHRAGVPTMLLMDGVVEHRNTFANPRVGEGFLRPAPVHAVACAGETCADVLTELGNDAWATGLPRLDHLRPTPMPEGATVVVATANTPFFDEHERDQLVRALATLRDTSANLGVRVLWRLTARLDVELGVTNDQRALAECLADARAVLTTPSTLLVEAMLAGRPAGVIAPYDAPLWHTTPWVWDARDAGSLPGLLSSLLDPGPARVADAADALAAIHPADGRSAERVAGVIADLASDQPREHAPPIVSLARAPERVRAVPGRARVLSLVWTDTPPQGGVPVWCARMNERFGARRLPYDVRTLYLTPVGFTVPEPERSHASVCVVPHDLDHAERVRVALDAARSFEPMVTIAHYADLPNMVASGLRYEGVRSVSVMHTDDADTERIVRAFDTFDGAVAVSDACARRLAPIAGDRPTATIPCAVPIADSARTPDPDAPLRLAYVGRMAELQKRVSDLARLARALDERRVACELHLVGDGPDLDPLLADLRANPPAHVRVTAHGPRPSAWVQRFIRTIDLSVLVSEFEGTSVTMMEAMGAGVVPCVTRVGSGLDGLIEDGVTGVTADVGDMAHMADRIAELAADRARLASIGAAAWRVARERTSLDLACDAWVGLLNQVMQRDLIAAPTDVSLRPAEAYRWTKHWADDPERAREFCVERLELAGYERVAVDPLTESPDADAVVFTGDVTPELADLGDRLRARGRGVVFARTLTEPEWSRVARAVRALAGEGCQRVAVFGVGDHTRRAARAFSLNLPIVGFIDDAPRAGTAFGLPVVPTDRALHDLRPDGVVLSSDAWEPAMWGKAEPLRAAGVKVRALYGQYADPSARATRRP